MLRTLQATRYVTPLREGGSVPAIVECDDDGLYVLKFRGAGQGSRALLAELLAGELARALGLRVPELVTIELDPALGRAERDEEIRDLIKASAGLNVGLDYLPGSITFDPVADPRPAPGLASAIVWFDALVTNIDRTAKNPNMLTWHKALWLIDHGAALYFHHDWENWQARAESPFAPIRDHVLLPYASELEAADARLRPVLTAAVLERIVGQLPEAWLVTGTPFATPEEHRAAYREYLGRRLEAAPRFVEEARRAHAALV